MGHEDQFTSQTLNDRCPFAALRRTARGETRRNRPLAEPRSNRRSRPFADLRGSKSEPAPHPGLSGIEDPRIHAPNACKTTSFGNQPLIPDMTAVLPARWGITLVKMERCP